MNGIHDLRFTCVGWFAPSQRSAHGRELKKSEESAARREGMVTFNQGAVFFPCSKSFMRRCFRTAARGFKIWALASRRLPMAFERHGIE
jgi:hypothetical protein